MAMRITVPGCVCVLVDMQERLYPHIHEAEALASSVRVLLEGLVILGVPIIATQQYTKGLGPTIGPIREVLPPESQQPVEKLAFGCCDEPAFLTRLRSMGRWQVVLAGIETHVCILQTALGLVERGYECLVVADGTGSREPFDRNVALGRLQAEGARLTTVESVLFELTRYAATGTFRAVSRLVK
jgi:nicotinamidase-related amidase